MEELVKQNASLETLSKGQEQALSKKEKQLQVAQWSAHPLVLAFAYCHLARATFSIKLIFLVILIFQ